MNNEDQEKEWVAEEHIHSLEAEFWALKEKAREAETWKKSLMYVKRAIGAGLSLTDYDAHRTFRQGIGQRMNKLDWDLDEAVLWVEKGWGFADWEEANAEKSLDNFHVILADVQAFLVKEGLIEAVEVTPESLENELEMLITQREIERIRGELAEPAPDEVTVP